MITPEFGRFEGTAACSESLRPDAVVQCVLSVREFFVLCVVESRVVEWWIVILQCGSRWPLYLADGFSERAM